MASDDEDEELKALRLAVLLSMKKKVEKEQSPPKKTGHVADLEALRHAALATIESAGVKPIVPQPIPSSNSPLFKSQSFPKVVNNNFNSSSPGPPRNRTRTSNLIVINPEPLDVPQKSVVSEKKSVDKPVLLRPQDKWCSPSTGTTISQVVEDSKPKVPSKFSRYDSSDSDSSDVSSDRESEEEKPLASPKHHSDSEEEKPQAPQLNSDSESDKRSLSPDTSSDSDSDDIEKQIDNILNSPEIKDKKTNLNDKTHEKVLKTKTPEKSIPVVTKIPDKSIQSVSKTEAPVSKKELHKSESKTIPTLIGGSKAGVRKKVSNAWSDSDSDSGIRLNRERQKLPKDKSWSDQGSSDEENKPVKNPNVSKSQMTASVEPPPQQKTKAEIEKEKEDRRRMIENDLQKTLKALQSIKEKRRKQEAVQKGPKDSKNHRSPEHRRRSRSLSPRRKSISPRRRNFDRRRSSSRSPRRRSFSPRRRRSRSYSKSLSRSPSGKRSPTSGLRKRKSPDSRKRRRSPLAFKGAYHRKSPYSKRSPKNIPSGNTSPDGQKEKRVLTSEERKKIEARRKKFENSAIEVKKTVSLKNIVRKSNSRECSPSPKINSPKDRTKKLAHSSKEFSSKKDLTEQEKKSSESRRKSNELKENNDNQDSDASKSSVSSLSDSDSDEEESRSWRKEQNNTKHLTRRNRTDASDRLDRPGFNRPRYERSKDDQQGFERRRGGESRLDRPRSGLDRARKLDRSGLDRPRTSDRLGLNRQQTNDRSGFERSRASDRLDLDRPRVSDRSELDKSSDSPRSRKGKKNIVDEDLGDKIKTGINDNESNVRVPKKIYRSDSHVFSDNVDRGFDASNYRKTKIDSGVASDCSDSEEALKEKKLISVVLPSDSTNNSPAQIITSPVRKVECSESVPTKSHRKHSKHRGERQKSKRVVITDMEEMPRKKKMKIESLGDARNLLEAIKSQDNPRRAVIRKDGISVTLEDDQEPNSPRKPSVHERLGRKVPSLMSLKTEDLRRGKSPEPEALKPITQESKKSKDKSSRKLERRDSSEKKSKKKRSIIHYDSPDEDTNEDNALEKRIQIIKEKNAAILKRQAEIQKDKEIFG